MGTVTYEDTNLVSRHRGTMPAILTCPHGGDEQPPGVPNPRTGMGLPTDCRFETNTDHFTRTITRESPSSCLTSSETRHTLSLTSIAPSSMPIAARSVHSRIATHGNSMKNITTRYATSSMRLGSITAGKDFFLTFMGPKK
jgi:hypothetical protein